MLVHSWIVNYLSPSIAQSIVFMKNACDVLNDLKERFAQGDLVRIYELMHEFYSLQQDSKSATAYYSKLKIWWEELDIYMPIPNCVCRVRCSCEFIRNVHPVFRQQNLCVCVCFFLTKEKC
jgi:hypothetical protein